MLSCTAGAWSIGWGATRLRIGLQGPGFIVRVQHGLMATSGQALVASLMRDFDARAVLHGMSSHAPPHAHPRLRRVS